MDNIEEIKKLFVPVELADTEAEKEYLTIVLFGGKEMVFLSRYTQWGSSSTFFWNVKGVFVGEKEPMVTHVLDMSQLTTKNRAVELAENSFKQGYTLHQFDCDECNDGTTFDMFINENKSIL